MDNQDHRDISVPLLSYDLYDDQDEVLSDNRDKRQISEWTKSRKPVDLLLSLSLSTSHPPTHTHPNTHTPTVCNVKLVFVQSYGSVNYGKTFIRCT